jgi:hypothetical protein
MTPAFKQAKTVHALDRAATVIGSLQTVEFVKTHKTMTVFIYLPNAQLNHDREDLEPRER